MTKKMITYPIKFILATTLVCSTLCHHTGAQERNGEEIKLYQKAYEEPIRTKEKLKFIKGDFIYYLYMNSSWVYYGNESPKVSLSAVNTNYKKEKFNIKHDTQLKRLIENKSHIKICRLRRC